MDKENTVGKRFADFKTELSCTFSLRCPKIENTKIKRKGKFDFEILLISQQIVDGKCDKLQERLKKFAESATKNLLLKDGEKVEFWNGGQS